MEKTEFLPNVQTEEKKENSAPVQSGAVNADMNAAAQQTQMDKFQAAQGHGYAAEQANNLYDRPVRMQRSWAAITPRMAPTAW